LQSIPKTHSNVQQEGVYQKKKDVIKISQGISFVLEVGEVAAAASGDGDGVARDAANGTARDVEGGAATGALVGTARETSLPWSPWSVEGVYN